MPPKASLNASLTPELMVYVGTLVASGRYRTASEVIRSGLRLLQQVEPAPPDQVQDNARENYRQSQAAVSLARNSE